MTRNTSASSGKQNSNRVSNTGKQTEANKKMQGQKKNAPGESDLQKAVAEETQTVMCT